MKCQGCRKKSAEEGKKFCSNKCRIIFRSKIIDTILHLRLDDSLLDVSDCTMELLKKETEGNGQTS